MLLIRVFIIGVVLAMAGCATKITPNTSTPSYAKEPAKTGRLAEFISDLTHDKQGQTGVYTLGQGVDAFVSRVSLINAATSSIDLQYYIYNNDITGNQINYSLYNAAERGVRVRLLLDDLKASDHNPQLHILNQHENVEIRLFNPSPNRRNKALGILTDFARLNSRMHNKSLTVDSLASVIGGRNIGDEYFSASHEVEFGDFDLLLIGEATHDVNTQFDVYWNSEHSYPLSVFHPRRYSDEETIAILSEWEEQITDTEQSQTEYIQALTQSQFLEYLSEGSLPWSWGKADVLYDPPSKINERGLTSPLLDELESAFANTQKDLFIISPYFVPGDGGTKYLIDMVERGVNVAILTNSLAATDVVAVHSGYAPYRKALLKAGVTLYETKVKPNFKPSAWRGSTQASLHAKSIIFDKQQTFVGSLNLDPRSMFINTEIGVLFENEALSSKIVSALNDAVANSAYRVQLADDKLIWLDMDTQKTFKSEPDASIWRKIGACFFRLLPIEDQL